MNDQLNLFKKAILIGGFLLMVVSLQAQINWLSDNRFVTISNFTEVVSETAPSNYAASQYPSTQFATFTGNETETAQSTAIPGSLFAYSHSIATQNSSITGNEFDINAEAYAQTWGGPRTDLGEEICFAEAMSFCQLTFSVDSPQFWILGISYLFSQGDVTVNLSDGSGSILGPLTSDQNGFRSYQGLLQPGNIYTLEFLFAATTDIPDPLGHDITSEGTMSFSTQPVPEPASLSLIEIGLLCFYAIRHKLKK